MADDAGTTSDFQPQSGTARAMAAARMLAWREIIRFFRQRNRVVGAVAQPIVFWVLFGVGLDRSFQPGPAEASPSFQEYFFPGTLVLIVLFTAIFATISIIEDRREGFLQGVLVAPLPRWSMVLGKVLGGSVIAVAQGLIFLLLALAFYKTGTPLALGGCVCMLWILALGLTSLGMIIAWRMESTQGFHAIMNLLLMPMWLLSGAFFPVPVTTDPAWQQQILHWVMRLNPLTYAVAGLRQLLGVGTLPQASGADVGWIPPLAMCWLVTVGFMFLAFTAAWRISSQRVTGDYQ